MNLLTRFCATVVAAAVPFVAVPFGLAWSVGPMARAGAGFIRVALSALPSAMVTGLREEQLRLSPGRVEPESDGSTMDDPSAAPSSATSSPAGRKTSGALSEAISAKRGATARRARASIFLGPDFIQRAIPV